MCVQLEDYSQIRESVKAYALGNVTILIGLSYTTYGLYEVIPKVGLPVTDLELSAPGMTTVHLKWGPSAIGPASQSADVQCVLL